MNELPPEEEVLTPEDIKFQKMREAYYQALELVEKESVFNFEGIEAGIEKTMIEDEEYAPGYSITVDEFKRRCNEEGVKVSLNQEGASVWLGGDPQAGNIRVMPAGSNDPAFDGIFARNLAPSSDEALNLLIELDRESMKKIIEEE